MNSYGFEERRLLTESPDESVTEEFQIESFKAILAEVLLENKFYREKLADVSLDIHYRADLQTWPFTTKDELLSDDPDGFAKNLTYSPHRYVRFHRTSGTRGRPLTVVDTAEDWQWWLEGWQFILDAAEIAPGDRVLMAFSFGPFIGFWSAFDAVAARGSLVIPTGGLSTLARLELLKTAQVTAVFCTPSYALHMADVAAKNGIDLRSRGVRRIVVAGEPGGSIPATRERIEAAWGAIVIDHAGATEVGPWGYQAFDRGEPVGLHVNEALFIPEFISIATGQPAADGELSELVLTTLGRKGCPVIRYRTGDLVRPRRQHYLRNRFVLLEGGVLGRVDDMLVIRGVNIFPSSVEAIVRKFPEVAEFRLIARQDGAMDSLLLEVEDAANAPDRIAQELQLRLGLRIEILAVPIGSLPRTEGKAQRFVDQRK